MFLIEITIHLRTFQVFPILINSVPAISHLNNTVISAVELSFVKTRRKNTKIVFGSSSF